MEQIIVSGGRPLRGAVRIHGAKNAALPIMAAALLAEGPTVLHRVPRLRDVETMAGVLRPLGLSAEWVGPQSLRLCPEKNTKTTTAPAELVRRMRGSVCVLGPLLATRGAAVLPLPGGCVLGRRPIDLHLLGLRALGAEISFERDFVRAAAARLHGARVSMSGPRGSTVLGTANVLMAAALARGTSVIEGAAREPEVQDLIAYLKACGARISGVGTSTLTVEGVERLSGGVEHELIPDRIEAATFLAAGVATGGCLTVEGACPAHMDAELRALESMGVCLAVGDEAVTASCPDGLNSCALSTAPYPGLSTDMQPQLSVLLCLARGTGAVEESVYPERFTHLHELQRMGARIERSGPRAEMPGASVLRGAAVRAADLRAGAALVLAGLAARGTTAIAGADQIERGYQDLAGDLARLGAAVRRQAAPTQERRPA